MNLPLPLLAPLLAVALIVLTLLILAKGRKERPVSYPYDAVASLFTPDEQRFLRVLEGLPEPTASSARSGSPT